MQANEAPPPKQTDIPILEQWLTENGVWMDREAIAIQHVPLSGDLYSKEPSPTKTRVPMAIFAKQSLAIDQVVCRIPKSCVLSPHSTAIREILQKEELGGSLALTVAYLYEKSIGSESRWADYLRTIPDCEDGLPIVWQYSKEAMDENRQCMAAQMNKKRKRNESRSTTLTRFPVSQALQMLENTEVGRCLRDELQLMREDYKLHVQPLLKAYPKQFSAASAFSFEAFLKASTVIASRCFQVDDRHGDALVPLADVFNHRTVTEHVHLECDALASSTPSRLNSKSEIDDEIELRIVRPVKNAGEQVFNTYGEHSSAFTLMKYGFVEEVELVENPFDVVTFSLEQVRAEVGEKGWNEERFLEWLENGYRRDQQVEEEMEVEEEEEEEEMDHWSTDDDDDDSTLEQQDDTAHSEADEEEIYFEIAADGSVDANLTRLLHTVLPDDPETHRTILLRLANMRREKYPALAPTPPSSNPYEYSAWMLIQRELGILRHLCARLSSGAGR